MKRCSKCEQELPPEAFHRNAASRDGLSAKCRTCARAYGRALDLRERGRKLAALPPGRESRIRVLEELARRLARAFLPAGE